MSRNMHIELAIAWTRVAILVVGRHRVTNGLAMARRHLEHAKAMPIRHLP